MADEDLRRRLERLEGVVDNGRFVRRDTYEADQRAQERTDLEQERRFADIKEKIDHGDEDAATRLDEVRDAITWLQRQLIIMLFGIVGAAVIAALALVNR